MADCDFSFEHSKVGQSHLSLFLSPTLNRQYELFNDIPAVDSKEMTWILKMLVPINAIK